MDLAFSEHFGLNLHASYHDIDRLEVVAQHFSGPVVQVKQSIWCVCMCECMLLLCLSIRRSNKTK